MVNINQGAQIMANMVGRQGRTARRPRHTFNVRFRPHEIMPVCIAPVLPGETMRNAVIQMRAVSDPVKFPLVGWWLEGYLFYVKLRDLGGASTYENMMLDPSTDVSSLRHSTGSFSPGYVADDDMNYVNQALVRIVEEYFRAPGEAAGDYVISAGHYAASIHGDTWLDSVVDSTTVGAEGDINVDLNANATITASEVDRAMRQYQFLNINGMTNMTFEDYLASFGIRQTQQEEAQKPELLRFWRDWQYPSNTINSSTGAPTSAVSWSIQETADKDRFFKEPGFIIGVCVARPKSYLKNQKGNASGMLDSAYTWLPAILRGDHRYSLKRVVKTDGPLQDTTNDYIVDIADLFMYGDQFINYDPTTVTTLAPFASLPNAGLTNKRYPSAADVSSWFVTATTAEFIRMDGVMQFTIASNIKDMT